MLQDLYCRAPQLHVFLEEALSTLETPFLNTQWGIAVATKSDPFEAIKAYCKSCNLEVKEYQLLSPAELNALPSHAVCEVEPGQFTLAANLPTPTDEALNIQRVLIIEKPHSALFEQSADNLRSLIDFWKRLSQTRWLTEALQAGFPSLKTVIWASILINFLALTTPFFSIQVYDRIIPNQAYTSLIALLVGVLLCLTFDHALKHARHRLTEYSATVSDAHCTELISSRLMQRREGQTDPAYLLQHLRSFESIREIITGMFMISLIDLPFLILFMGVISLVHPYFLIIDLSAIALTCVCVVWSHKHITRIGHKQIREHRQNQSKWLDCIHNLQGLQLHGIEQAYGEELTKGQLLSRISGNHMRESVFGSNQVIYLIQQLCWVSSICLGVYLIIEQHISTGGLVAVSMLTMRSFAPISRLQNQLIQTHAAQAGFEDLDRFLAESTLKEGQHPLNKIENLQLSEASVLKPGRSNNAPVKQDFLLHHVNLALQAGQRIGVVGPTGSGKTSLLKLLANHFSLYQGALNINHMNAEHYRHSEIGKCIGFAEQPPMLMKGTLLENLKLRRPWVSTEDCVRAIESVGLGDWLKKQSDGLSLEIEHAGSNLSSGQKQLVSLARALAGKPTLLLLDEPTVCLDSQSEQTIIQALKTLSDQVTLVFTTHKLNLLSCCNQLVLVHEGELLASGDKAQVLKQAQSLQEKLNA